MVVLSLSNIFISFLLIQTTVSNPDDDDDVCDAPVADSCFSDVQDDLKFIFDPKNNFMRATNETALKDLCDAWKDSLQCTRDIVDTTCTKEEGKERFDVWNDGLTRGVNLLCHNGMINLKAIADTVQCWNMVTFLYCVENRTHLNHIDDLLKTPLSGEECDNIKFAFDDCHWEATNLQCPVYEVVRSTIEHFLRELFQEIDCEEKAKPTKQMLINCSSFITFSFCYIIVSFFVSSRNIFI